MSSIRKQSIFSTLIIYGGFFIGLINTYLFTRKGFFTEEQFGLYNVFIAIAILLAAIGNLGAPYFIYKFFPYYQARYQHKKNDQLTLAMILAVVGFLLLLLGGQIFEPLIIKKYSTNSALLVQYFNWVYPLAGGLLLFTILESWSWQQQLSVKSNLLKEGVWRLYILLIIIAYLLLPAGSFRYFVAAFAISYPIIAVLLGLVLYQQQKLPFTLQFTDLTKRLQKPILHYSGFTYLGTLIFVIAQVFDSILISSVLNQALAQLAIYSLAQNMASILQAPQRGIIAASMEPLSRAWKEKDRFTLNKIYQRSSINLLLFSAAIFGLILINYQPAITTLDLKPSFLAGFSIFLLLGLARIVDLGTGVNSQLIVTSPGWRFEFYSGVILLCCMLPLSYWLTKRMGITGTALAQLISISIYNSCRLLFLWFRFKLQPFSATTLQVLIFSTLLITGAYFLGGKQPGWTGMILRSTAYLFCWGWGVWFFKLTPDLQPIVETIQKRWSARKYFR
jgi:O-antigen/teichoic acid export membrane protein